MDENLREELKTFYKNKKIILGITGSIAAYKTPLLVRELIKAGAHVNVIMTEAATEFVTPMTLENLSRNPVIIKMFERDIQSGGAWHIQLAHWADIMLVAPCSATTLGKLAGGICDNPLVTVATALPKGLPLIIAPAMDSTMFLHESTQRNIRQCIADGALYLPPDEGELSSGSEGPGRFPDIPIIIENVKNLFEGKVIASPTAKEPGGNNKVNSSPDIDDILSKPDQSLEEAIDADKFTAELELEKMKLRKFGLKTGEYLKGKKVLITAGPTHEKIDDVRYIGNQSSGKMGFAIANEARQAGADVTIISGPVNLPTPQYVSRVDVESANDMLQAVMARKDSHDIIIMAAAVADFTPEYPKDGKIKKGHSDRMELKLIKTVDILSRICNSRQKGQIIAGFALEAENELEYGRKKLHEKKCDMIVINSSSKPDSGFGGDKNTITIITKDGVTKEIPPMSKVNCAKIILSTAAGIN
ncbi:MAG: bifunctional phosphopantothenoylcysteine decarboxylase/phosphopantothenate--cysteine ligase CoaBC [Bacteroidota bacterium]